jgi:two-component system chemotaxis sensor kinase CheA
MADELLDAFVIEGREFAAAGHGALSVLAADAGNREAIDDLFRTLHTLKGSAGLFELPALTALLHAVESALDLARRAGRLSAQDASAARMALDLTEAWLDVLEQGGASGPGLIAETQAATTQVLDLPAESPGVTTAAARADDQTVDWAEALARSAAIDEPAVALRYRPAPDAYFRGDDPLALIKNVPGLTLLQFDLSSRPADFESYDPFRCTLEISALSLAPMDDVRNALRFVADEVSFAEVAPDARAAPATSGPETGALRAIRVDAQRLDELAALTDALVIAKNELLHRSDGLSAPDRRSAVGDDFERLVTTLHGAVMEMRLTPLAPLFARFPRRVRELAETLGKSVEFEVSGETTSVDKSVVEGLFTPLLHLLRNALDHGVEAPTVRASAGKPATARLSISARTEGDTVLIEVADDGRGIDPARVRRAAVEAGVVTADQAAAMGDEDAAGLIFAPGFSTADQLSELSGRGVGMDAVQATVTQFGGRVALDNRPGQGLTVRLFLPARVVLTKLLVMEAGGCRFGAPMTMVEEVHQVAGDEVSPVRVGRAYVRRDSVVPILRLAELLDLEGNHVRDFFPVVVTNVDGELIGMEVDAVAERIETPLRPMTGLLSGYPGVLGTSLQADGKVLLVLDLAYLARQGARV